MDYNIELNTDSFEPYEINLFEQESDSILHNQAINLTKLPEPTVLLIHNSTSKLMGVSSFVEVDINRLEKSYKYTFVVELKASNKIIDSKSTSILIYVSEENK